MQNTQNNEIGVFEIGLMLFFGGVILIPIYNKIHSYFLELKTSLLVYVVAFTTYIALIIISLICHKILKGLLSKITYIKTKARLLQEEKKQIENILYNEAKFNQEGIRNNIKVIKDKIKLSEANKKLNCFNEKLKKRLEIYLKLLEELKKEDRVLDRKNKLGEIEKQINEKEKQLRIKTLNQEQDKEKLLQYLNTEENNVFIKSELNKNQIKALESQGFKQVNEYSAYESKFIRVLIKQVLNHKPTHTFLVWDIKRILEDNNKAYNIVEHLTKDADITFYYNRKKFALEIETGTLLERKKHLQEKLEYLNKRYKRRWIFIVSNKNLLSKYKKLGFATQRKDALKNIKKLLENY